MKKITLWLFLLLITNSVFSQFGCGSAVVISDGYTATGITTPGTGGVEDWNTNPTGTSINASYWDDDVYLFQYTAGVNSEEISMTIFSINSWNGIGIFTDCTGNTFSGELDAASATTANASKTVTAVLNPSQTVYIAVGQWGTPNGLNFNVTSFSAVPLVNPPSCVALSNPTNGATNISSAQISWPAATGVPDGYKLNVGTTSGGTDVLNLFDVGNVLTYNLGALVPNTTYYVTVVPYNANGDSTGCSESTFVTCGANLAPWTYDVEAAGLTTNSSIADCWSSIPTGTTSSYRWNVDGAGGTPSSPTTGPTGANSGVKYFYVEATSGTTGAIAELYSPLVDISGLTNSSLQFYYHMFGAAMGELHIDIYNGSAWVNDVDVIVGQQQTAQADPWIQRIIDLSAYSGTIQARFRAIRGTAGTGDISLDDITFDEAPACLPPTNLTAYNITDTTVDINWTENGSAFDWEYVVQSPGSGIPTSSGVAIDTQPYEVSGGGGITGLTPNTTYEIYIRSTCSFTSQSSWLGPVAFTTECAIFTVPSLENFTTYVPGCWEEADNGDLTAGPATYGSSSWIADGFGNVGTSGSARYEIWLASANDWLITPTYTIPVTGYELKFDAAATQWNTTTAPTTPWEADDYVEVLISTSGTNNWTVLYTYNNTNVPLPTGTTNIIDLDTYAGQNVKFAFRAVEGPDNGAADLNFYIDNFEIRLTPSSPPVCATNVVATPNTTCGNFATAITWDAVSGANGYRINIGTATGATDVLNNFDLGTALTYNHLGSINTNYFVTILPYNVNGNATGCSEITYMTNVNGCYCTSVPTSNDASGISNVQLGATNFPTADVTYFDHTATPVTLAQGVSSNVQITFATGYTYNTYIYIDFNNDFDFTDAGELVFTGESAGTNPTTYNASFILPSSAPLGNHRMRIVTADDLVTSDPCYSDDYGVTLDFTINIIAPSCTPPAFSTAIVSHNCVGSVFNVNVNITALGNGSPSITDGVSTWPVTAVGNIQVGPFSYGTPVTLTLNHGSDNVCNIPIGTFNFATCPPVNDECSNAISLTVNTDYNCGSVVSGTVQGATASTVDSAACFGTEDDDVWYSFVATQTTHRIQLTNVAGSTTDLYHSLWTGVNCNSLTLVPNTCSDPNTSNPTGLTIGQTYYLRVYTWTATTGQTSTFDVCIGRDPLLSTSTFDSTSFKAYPNPVKDILTLEYTTAITSVRIMNLLGQEVISRNVNANETKIDMSQLNSGAYIVNVIIDDTVQSIKVIKE